MGDNPGIPDENFIRKYEAYETDASRNPVNRHTLPKAELEQLIASLIQRRAELRREELHRLQAEAASLIEKLRHNEKQQLLEELECFKDTLSLQKQLLDENGKP